MNILPRVRVQRVNVVLMFYFIEFPSIMELRYELGIISKSAAFEEYSTKAEPKMKYHT